MSAPDRIVDRCPSCGNRTLFIGTGGYLTCSWQECRNPAVGDALAALQSKLTAPIDNGNVFVFCDYVSGRMACVRGAGHNGPHALSMPSYPQGPVLLVDAAPDVVAGLPSVPPNRVIREGESSPYTRDECPFAYCDAPDTCRPVMRCRHRPPLGVP